MEIDMPAPKKSLRPKARSSAPKKSLRPKGRDDAGPQEGSTRHPSGKNIYEQDTVRGKAAGGKMAYGGKAKVKKMKDGGKCRGMGAATRGGAYKMG